MSSTKFMRGLAGALILFASPNVVHGSPVANDSPLNLAARESPSSLSIGSATLTSKWFEGSDYVQIIEMIVTNKDTVNSVTKADDLTITASSTSFDLVTPAKITRLIPGQSITVQVGVKNKSGVSNGATCSGTITATWGNAQTATGTVSGMCGFGDYTATKASLNHHWTPQWYNDAKFGIFIHWGVYAVPAFGNQGAAKRDYAEWYWMRMTQPNYKSQTYQYHLATYGENFNYDDFIPSFTGSAFDAKEWMDVIDAAGAKYMVPVSKHHEGFAIFDVPKSTSLRSSVQLGPKRDFLAELMSAAKSHYPGIRRGTYFSMPEWFNPDYKKYGTGTGGGFPGGPPTNPYTGEEIPYTGHVNISDYVIDLQKPQMETLAYDSRYETELMWCDIGGANNATIVLSEWLNWARDQGRQVTYNNRCGYGSSNHQDASGGDYITPEYATQGSTTVNSWESNRGMDPFSFGYNKDTPDSDYLTGEDVIQTLVDIVSKNGNFLLDIGPMANGTIPQIMVKGLKDAGSWLKERGESIYGTRYYHLTSGSGDWRYTTTNEAFYIHLRNSTSVPSSGNSTLQIPDKIPVLSGDSIEVLGGSSSGKTVPYTLNSDGTVAMNVDKALFDADRYVWTFKVVYGS